MISLSINYSILSADFKKRFSIQKRERFAALPRIGDTIVPTSLYPKHLVFTVKSVTFFVLDNNLSHDSIVICADMEVLPKFYKEIEELVRRI